MRNRKMKIVSLMLAVVLVVSAFFVPTVQAEETKGGFAEELDKAFQMAEENLANAPQKFGYECKLNFEFNIKEIPEPYIPVLNKLNAMFKFAVNNDSANPQFNLDLALSNMDTPDNQVNFALYNVAQKIFVELPQVLPKALMLDVNSIEEMTGQKGINFETLAATEKALQAAYMKDFKALIGIVDGKLETLDESTVALQAGELSEELTAKRRSIKGEKIRETFIEVLEYVKASESFALIKERMATMQIDGSQNQDLDAELDKMIEELKNVDPAEIKEEVIISNLFDAEGNFRGLQFSLVVDGAENLLMQVAELKQDDKSGIVFDMNDMNGEQGQFISNYTVKDEAASGTFSLSSNGEELAYGDFENLKVIVDEQNPQFSFLDGKFNLNIKAQVGSANGMASVEMGGLEEVVEELPEAEAAEEVAEESEEMSEEAAEEKLAEGAEEVAPETEAVVMNQELKVQYEAQTNGDVHNFRMTFVPNAEMADQYVAVIGEERYLNEEEVVIRDAEPAEVYDVNNPDDMKALQEDPTIQQNVFNIAAILGLLQATMPSQQ